MNFYKKTKSTDSDKLYSKFLPILAEQVKFIYDKVNILEVQAFIQNVMKFS